MKGHIETVIVFADTPKLLDLAINFELRPGDKVVSVVLKGPPEYWITIARNISKFAFCPPSK